MPPPVRPAAALLLLLFLSAAVAALLSRPSAAAARASSSSSPSFFNVTRGFVIALDAGRGAAVAAAARQHLGIAEAAPFAAVDGTRAVLSTALPVYTRMLMRTGRHDHMQLSNAGMLGCLLSHLAIWRLVRPGETVAVFEEDALLDGRSTANLAALARDLRGVPWDLLVLERGQIIATGDWRSVGELAATCVNQTTCTWYGTRGYLLTHRGAASLIRHAEPIAVQVDALMGLVAAFEPGFRMYWTRADVAFQTPNLRSQVWDGCIKCFLPSAPLFYVCAAAVWLTTIAAALQVLLQSRRGGDCAP